MSVGNWQNGRNLPDFYLKTTLMTKRNFSQWKYKNERGFYTSFYSQEGVTEVFLTPNCKFLLLLL